MKRIARVSTAVALIFALSPQLVAQIRSQQVSPFESRPAARGDIVVVQFRDGRAELTGTIGKWVDDVGFYVKPMDSAAYLLHPSDVLVLRDVKSGQMLGVPARPHQGIGRTAKIVIGAAAALAGFMFLLRTCALCGPIG